MTAPVTPQPRLGPWETCLDCLHPGWAHSHSMLGFTCGCARHGLFCIGQDCRCTRQQRPPTWRGEPL